MSRIRHAPPSASRNYRAEPTSRPTPSSFYRRSAIEAHAASAFEESIARLAGVGPRLGERLAKLGVRQISDLLCLLPQRYEDRTAIRPLGALVPGEKTLVEGVVELSEIVFRRRRALLCRLSDGTGALTLRFFHFSKVQQQHLERGARLRCFGEVRAGPTGLEMVHPEYTVLGAESTGPASALTPVYPSTEGLQQQRIRRLVEQALARLERQPLEDHLRDLLDGSWPGLNESLRLLHQPPKDADVGALLSGRHPCQRRLALEELVAQRLSLRRSTRGARQERAASIAGGEALLERLRASLQFRPTGAQERAIAEILADLRAPYAMHRLVQGDVGSGKTLVAAFAAAAAAAAGYQTAVMAPTELLAEQHFASFERWLRPLGIEVVPLVGSQTARSRSAVLRDIESGAAHVIVGTHALFQETVTFKSLALVIVDEQHRFGVEQRLKLKQKGGGLAPHQLVMTATPIPRTLAMTAYADLDCSVLDELPPGRTPVRTVVLPEQRRPELVERVGAHCASGQQAYWVCPLIEESEAIDSSAANALEQGLRLALPQVRVGLIHGRMKSAEKEQVMRAFKDAQLDLLVATTVIEVGVDVPNATLMVIENAERMGLAQLHQLRGRVGRGQKASSCVLLYKPPLSALARERLQVMRATTDGFAVAQKDLELRGPGEVLGTRQTGIAELRVADLVRDADLLSQVIALSDRLEAEYPERVQPLIERWVRGGREYAKV